MPRKHNNRHIIRKVPVFVRLIVIVVLSSGSLQARANTEPYWILEDGSALSTAMHDGNEAGVQADEWQILLYPSCMSANGGPGRWGLIIGKTAADARNQLRKAQAFDRRYEKWAGIQPQQDHNNSFNPFGPIAVIRHNTTHPDIAAALDRIEQLHCIIDDMEESKDVFELLSGRKAPATPTSFDAVGSVFKDYVDALRIARTRVMELKA